MGRHLAHTEGASHKMLYILPLLPLQLAETVPSFFQPRSSDLAVDPRHVRKINFYPGYYHLEEAELPVRACFSPEQQPSFVGWPFAHHMRLRLSASDRTDAALVPFNARWTDVPPRGFCKVLLQLVPPSDSDIVELFCEDCTTKPCSQVVDSERVFGTKDLAFSLPARGGCILLDQLPGGTHIASVKWEQHFDWSVLARLVCGLALVWSWKWLRESSTLHAALGGLGSLFVVIVVAGWWFAHTMRDTIHGSIPFGRLLTSLTVLLCALVPAMREALIAMVLPNDRGEWWTVVNKTDPFLNLPVVWIAIAVFGLALLSLVTLGARYSLQIFATPPDPEGQVDFYISSDGSRVDVLPAAPLSQRCLGWLIWAAGLLLLLNCSQSDIFSSTVAILAVCKDEAFHAIAYRLQSMRARSPASLRPLVSRRCFDEKGRAYTQRSLERLRQHVAHNQRLFSVVSAESQHRLRRFSDWGLHVEPPAEPEDESRQCRCVVL